MSHLYEYLSSTCTQPLLKIIAKFSQHTDFNLSVIIFHFFTALCCLSFFVLLYSHLRKSHCKKTNKRLNQLAVLSVLISSFYFWLSAASQNAITPYIFPSYHRESLLLRTSSKEVVPEKFITWRTEKAIREFVRNFHWEEYQSLSHNQVLEDGQTQLLKLGKILGYHEGPQTQKLKILKGVPRLLGYAYGGPAYYDSFTHEIIIPDQDDYPASNYFYISTIVHELSHALFFQRELDATLMQYKAMLNSEYSTIRALANFLWLEYSPFVKHPNFYKYLIESGVDSRFVNEVLRSRKTVRKKLKSFYNVQLLKNLMRKIKFQNQAAKYGWQPEKYAISPFYKVIFTWEYDQWKSNPISTDKFVQKFNWSK